MNDFLIDCPFKSYSMAPKLGRLIQRYNIWIARHAALRVTLSLWASTRLNWNFSVYLNLRNFRLKFKNVYRISVSGAHHNLLWSCPYPPQHKTLRSCGFGSARLVGIRKIPENVPVKFVENRKDYALNLFLWRNVCLNLSATQLKTNQRLSDPFTKNKGQHR
jgi:hypothetical protein